MIERIKEFLYSEWPKYFPDRSCPTVIRALISRGSYGRHSKTTFLLFANRETKPFAIIKVPLFEDGSPFIRREHEILTRLAREVPRHVHLRLPRCWLIEDLEGLPILLETALLGDPLRKVAKRSHGNSLLATGIHWISQLHLMTRIDHCFTERDYQELVVDPLMTDLQHPSAVQVEADKLNEIASRLKVLIGEKVPWVCSHNDFRVSNLRIHNNALLVYDWEFAAWPGLPMLDLLNFAVDYSMETRPASFAQAFTAVLSEDNRGSHDIYAHLKNYCAQMGMDESLIPLWTDLFLIHKLRLAQEVVLPLQIFDGLEWAQDLGKAIRSRGTPGGVC